MKKKIMSVIKGLMVIVAVMVVVVIVGVGILIFTINVSDAKIEAENKKAFEQHMEIEGLINAGKWEDAWEKLEAKHGGHDYTGVEGFVKMTWYCLYYEKKESYDDAVRVILDCIEENKYMDRLGSFKDVDDEFDFRYSIKRINENYDFLSEEMQGEVMERIGEEVMEKYNSLEIEGQYDTE